jgi:hypothetical protein
MHNQRTNRTYKSHLLQLPISNYTFLLGSNLIQYLHLSSDKERIMKEYTMVIPTYWGRPGDELVGSEKIIFDHPTPLNEEGTLPRLLHSLSIVKKADRLRIVIISVPNDSRIWEQVSNRLEEIIKPFRDSFNITTLDIGKLEKIKGELTPQGVSAGALDLLNLNNYAAVRNMCALAGILNKSPNTIFIDDDEVFTDLDFIHKIEESMGLEVNGKRIEALAGYYLQPDTYRLDESRVPVWRAQHWNNVACMNDAFDLIIGRGPRLKSTPFVFGGNMTVALNALKKVPFDPKITRGEDIDFLLNLRISGIHFYLDRELSIKHLPPPSAPRPDWKKLREDALRFLYERKKVIDHRVIDINDLMPYPGRFLGDDLEELIVKTSRLLLEIYESKDDIEGIQGCRSVIALAEEDPFKNTDTSTWLQNLALRWQELTEKAVGMGISE